MARHSLLFLLADSLHGTEIHDRSRRSEITLLDDNSGSQQWTVDHTVDRVDQGSGSGLGSPVNNHDNWTTKNNEILVFFVSKKIPNNAVTML